MGTRAHRITGEASTVPAAANRLQRPVANRSHEAVSDSSFSSTFSKPCIASLLRVVGEMVLHERIELVLQDSGLKEPEYNNGQH